MDVQITPVKLAGHVTLPASKSHCHRLLIASYLAGSLASGKEAIGIENDLPIMNWPGDDIVATIEALEQLQSTEEPKIYCKESGSTLRFLLPVAAVLHFSSSFYGQGRLPKRPLSPLLQQMKNHGCKISNDSTSSLICKLQGKLQGGEFFLPGNISSQFITGLLFALPLTASGGHIHLTTALESSSYVDLTIQVLSDFGIVITKSTHKSAAGTELITYHVAGNQHYQLPSTTGVLQPESDWSAAAFWHVANRLGCHIILERKSRLAKEKPTINSVKSDASSLQGDKAIVDIIRRVSTTKTIDASNIPDLVPIIAVLLALTPGKREIIHADRLRFKESDRLHETAKGLTALGATVTEINDGLVIVGKEQLDGGIVHGARDHRIIMSMAIAAIGCKNPVTITGAQSISKSYPLFFHHYEKLGGQIVIQ